MGNRNISLYGCEVEKDNSQSRESTCDMVLVTQQWDSYGHNLLYNLLSLANYLSLLLRPMDPEPCFTHQQRPDSVELHLRSLYLGGIYSGLAICLVSWCHSVPRVLHVVKLKWEISSICMSHADQQCTRLVCCMLKRKMVASHFKFKSESSWDP